MVALSVSISTSSSPLATSSPSDFSHFRIVPSSIESDRRGMTTSAMDANVATLRSRRQCGEVEPEPLDGPQRLDELLELERLGHVGVRVQVVRAHDVVARRRAGQDDDRHPPQGLVRLALGEHLEATLAWQV